MVLRSEQIAQEAVGDNRAERRGKDVREGRKEVNHMAENTAWRKVSNQKLLDERRTKDFGAGISRIQPAILEVALI